MEELSTLPAVSGDNILVYAVLAGVAVVLISSALSVVFRVVAVAALVFGGWLYHENPDKAASDAGSIVSEVESSLIERLPEESQGNARQIIANAMSTASEITSDENVNSLFERALGGLDRLQEIADEYESTKGVLPESIEPISGG